MKVWERINEILGGENTKDEIVEMLANEGFCPSTAGGILDSYLENDLIIKAVSKKFCNAHKFCNECDANYDKCLITFLEMGYKA